MTACDGPSGYAVHGIPPNGSDDGTIAPTAAGGSLAFAPEYSLPTLRYFYSRFRPRIWTAYGFRDAFNLGLGWYATDALGIDQGPIVIMIENYRTQKVWRLFMQNAEVQRGLQRAGFPLPFMAPGLQPVPGQEAFDLSWSASATATTRSNTLPTCSLGGVTGVRPGHQHRSFQLARQRAAATESPPFLTHSGSIACSSWVRLRVPPIAGT